MSVAAMLAALPVVPGSAGEFGLPPFTSHDEPLSIWGTVYYVSHATAVAPGNGVELRSPDGPTGLSLSKTGWCNAALEGTVRVQTPRGVRTFNHAGFSSDRQTNCDADLAFLSAGARHKVERALFTEVPSDAPYGLGSDPHYRLVPYRTVAVDPSVVRIGTVLYLPALRGMHLPSGKVHDGYVFAADTGTGVEGRHIDFFTGLDGVQAVNLFNADRAASIPAFRVSTPEIVEYLRLLHRRN